MKSASFILIIIKCVSRQQVVTWYSHCLDSQAEHY